MNTLMKFAKTRQGRKLTNQAMAYARSPQGKSRSSRSAPAQRA